jgi:hypothetical protein
VIPEVNAALVQIAGPDIGMIEDRLAVRERINVISHKSYLQFRIQNSE